MRAPYTQLFAHLVWATWDRVPFLTEEIRPQVYACLQAECTRMKVNVVAIGGVADHVHLLVLYPSTVSIATLVKQLKGVSSHLVNHGLRAPFTFKWQGGYGAFSVSKRSVPRARDYILRQEERHRDGTLYPEVEPG